MPPDIYICLFLSTPLCMCHCNYLQVQNARMLHTVITYRVLIWKKFLCMGFILYHNVIRHPRQAISTIAEEEHRAHRCRENLSLLEIHVYSQIALHWPVKFLYCFKFVVHAVENAQCCICTHIKHLNNHHITCTVSIRHVARWLFNCPKVLLLGFMVHTTIIRKACT